MTFEVALLVALLIVSVNLIFVVPGLWKGDRATIEKVRRGLRPYWVFGDELLQGLLRATPTLSVGILMLCLGLVLVRSLDLPPMPGRWEDMSLAQLAATTLLTLWLLSMVLGVSIALLGRPRTLVPPGLR